MDAASARFCDQPLDLGKQRGGQRPSFLPPHAVYAAPRALPRIGAPARHAPPTVSMSDRCSVQYTPSQKCRKTQGSFHRQARLHVSETVQLLIVFRL